MNILSLSKTEIEDLVNKGFMRPESLKHYDICKALSEGLTQEKAADKFGLTDDSYIRKIKNKKCPECNK